MQVAPASAHPVSPYVKAYNSLKIENNNFLIRSVIASIEQQAAPQYPWGSDAAQMDQLGQTVGALKSAWQTGLYGFHRYAAVGTNINTHA